MSIVKMKRLRAIGFSEERDNLLQKLLHMGCVEISEPEDKVTNPEWTALLRRDTSALADRKAEASALASALDALKKYAPAKRGLFIKRKPISEADFFREETKAAALESAEQINACTREISRLWSVENKLNAALASLTPWASLDLPLEQEGTSQTAFLLGTVPAATEVVPLKAELSAATSLAELIEVSADKEQQYLLLIVHTSAQEDALSVMRPHSFGIVRFKDLTGTAQQNIDQIGAQLRDLADQRKQQEELIAAQGPQREILQLTQDRVNQEISREAVAERFLTDGRIFFVEGWIPAEKVSALASVLSSEFTCAWETTDPQEGDTVPTLLKDPKWMQGINMVTEMYSLPAYDGIDPNPLYFFWYVFFFGFMFADVAYGIIIFAVCAAVIKLYHPKKTMGYMFHLGLWLGGSTAICGVFVGGFFGNALEVIYETFLPNAVMPGWMQAFCDGLLVNPVSDPMTVLIVALVIGLAHLIMGQCIHIYMGFRDGKTAGGIDAALDYVPWWLFLAGLGVMVLNGSSVLLIASVVILLVTQGRHEKGFLKKAFGGIKSLYGVTDWLSDILSYARLMALMLATSVIAQVFNTLGALPKNIIAFAVVFVIGHVFNIGVNIIGTYVHAARLQYLEYFGKFYKDGGIAFQPLKYDTKYVDITNEEEN